MRERLGKDYFKKTSIATGLLHALILCIFGYCLSIMLLPNVAIWVLSAIMKMLDLLSFGDENLRLFNYGFFFTCTGLLVLLGISLKIYDYIQDRKEKNDTI